MFQKDEVIHVSINWLWNLADVKKAISAAGHQKAAHDLADLSNDEVCSSLGFSFKA